jgi:hypothetical protein
VSDTSVRDKTEIRGTMGPVEPLIWRGGQAVSFERERGVAHVEVQPGIVHVTVRLSEHAVAAERLALLQTLAEAGVPVFLVKLHPCALSFAVRAEFRRALRAVALRAARGERCPVA